MFSKIPDLSNCKPLDLNVKPQDSESGKFYSNIAQLKLFNTGKPQEKGDLVEAISEAAKKLLKDPNSYYHNLKKDEKQQIAHMPNFGIDDELMTAQLPKINLENQFTFNKNQNPIEPYIKGKSIDRQKEEEKSGKPLEKNVPELPSFANPAPKDNRGRSLDLKPIIKKKVPEPVQVKLPPPPKYEPLPCLDCKNIKSVCDALKIEKIDEVIKLVNENKHGKL